MPSLDGAFGAFALADAIFEHVERGTLGQPVLDLLLPAAGPLAYETELWDYKSVLPTTAGPVGADPGDYKRHMAELVKDVVAFHNSLGGYILIGVRDNPRGIIGIDRPFNCDDLNKMVFTATSREIHTRYTTLSAQNATLGLLLIPRRPDGEVPVMFERDAPAGPKNTRAYSHGNIYYRRDGESKIAETSEELRYLWAASSRRLSFRGPIAPTVIHNLGPRDPTLIEFIGRAEYLDELSRWHCDAFSLVRLLSGYGGLGKTTIARKHVEQVIQDPPADLVSVIWLTAKARFFDSLANDFRPNPEIHFKDVKTLLRAVLRALLVDESDIDPDSSIQQMSRQVIRELSAAPSLLVIDDIDSLEDEEQRTVYHELEQICSQSARPSRIPSRALLTARHDLGAPPAQLIKVAGLREEEFAKFVYVTADAAGVKWAEGRGPKHMERFCKVADGSPLFAAGIVRLMRVGYSLDVALSKWKSQDGEAVREFAFAKEIERLSDSSVRTLFALAQLGDASQVELKQVTQSTDVGLQKDLEELRKFSLVSTETGAPKGGPKIIAPIGIGQMIDVLKKRVADPNRIEKASEEIKRPAKKSARAGAADVAEIIRRTQALWKDGQTAAALEVAKFGIDGHGKNADLWCLYGTALLKAEAQDATEADVAFRKAFELGCSRVEHLPGWIEAKELKQDWVGVLDVAERYKSTHDAFLAKAVANARLQLGLIAQTQSDYGRAAEHFRGAALEAKKRIVRERDAPVPLHQILTMSLREYVNATAIYADHPGSRIDVWDAAMFSVKNGLRDLGVIRRGLSALQEWWSSVELRPRYDEKTAKRLAVAIREIGQVLIQPQSRVWSEEAQRIQSDLQSKLQRYEESRRNETPL